MKNELYIQLLGGFAVTLNGFRIPESQWKSRRARNLVKMLALTPTHRLHREEVIDTFWPDSDLTASVNSFHQSLYAARRALAPGGEDYLSLEEGFLTLAGSCDLVVDVEQFEKAAARAKGSQELEAYQVALDLYRGDLLPEDKYEEWTLERREGLRQDYLQILLGLARLHEERQEYPAAIGLLEVVLSMDKAQEEAHAGLMRLYALSGQRHQALRQYQILREVLRAELDVEPSQAATLLYEAIQSGRFGGTAVPGLQPGGVTPVYNLPVRLTSFIGREQEIAEVSHLVRNNRLVTLTGAGGTGKTRLAIQVAEGMQSAFPNGVCWVDLAPLSDFQQMTQEVANALGIHTDPGLPLEDQLLRYLHPRSLLLVLDNCEHLVESCAHLAILLLKACPNLRILATSRESLGVEGEAIYPLATLEFPDPDHLPSLEVVKQYEAVQLFSERAVLVFPGFTVTQDNARAIAQLCQRLDGMPLPLELTAAHINLLSLNQIVDRLDTRLWQLTTSPRAQLSRHRSLQACLDWSYALLSARERILLSRLAVFTGSFTLAAAEAVCSDPPGGPASADKLEPAAILGLLSQLVSKSLVTAALATESKPQQEMRYRLLDTIHQYAAEVLAGSPEEGEAVREQHSVFFLDLLVQRYSDLIGRRQAEAVLEISGEFGNVRAAWDWAVSQGMVELLFPAVRSMCILCSSDEHVQIGEEICRKTVERFAPTVLADPVAFSEGIRLLIQLWSTQANLSCLLGNASQADQLLQQAADLLERATAVNLQLDWEKAFFLTQKGRVKWLQSLPDQSQVCYRHAQELFHSLGDMYWEAITLHDWSYLPNSLEENRRLLESALDIFYSVGSSGEIALVLQEEGLNACRQGCFEESERLIRESLVLCQESNDRFRIAQCTFRLGEALMMMGRFEEAQPLLEQSLSGLQDLGSRIWARLCTATMTENEVYLGNYARVRQLCQEALADKQEIKFLWGVLVHFHLMLSLACLATQQTTEALEWLTQAEGRRFSDREFQGLKLAIMGTAALQLKQMGQAGEYLLAALQVWEQCEDHDILSFSLPAIALLLIRRGDSQRAVDVYTLAHRYSHVTHSRWFGDVFGQPLAEIFALPEAAFSVDTQVDLKAAVHELLRELTK